MNIFISLPAIRIIERLTDFSNFRSFPLMENFRNFPLMENDKTGSQSS